MPESGRLPGHGTPAQVRADLAALAERGVTYVVFDTCLTAYLGLVPPERSPRHDPELLEAVAGDLMDLRRAEPA
ncbi:hypothetical protein [Streptomyces sp. NPDC051567]|uniref:hypothetical protein n=1 Tax=Streptomyces sp. NPDC051567 TaxID=3365660 RepID=UPI0037918714